MEELNTIIKELKEVCSNNDLIISNEILFENACDIFISDRINKEKKEQNKKWYQQQNQIRGDKEEEISEGISQQEYYKETGELEGKTMITPKQLSYLKKHGYKNPETLTKFEAKEVISNYIKNLEKKNI